jgi:hypothetical protein
MKRIILAVCLLIAALPLSAQLLTKEKISSDLGSKSSYNKQEVVDLIYQITLAYDASDIALEKRLVAENDARFENWKTAYTAGLAKAEADARAVGLENGILWTSDAVIGLGLIIYGIYKADPAIIATGGLMAGGGALRLVIAIK